MRYFCALNKITKKDKFPLPLIKDQIDRLGGGNKYFITLGLSQGFYQIPIEERDQLQKQLLSFRMVILNF